MNEFMDYWEGKHGLALAWATQALTLFIVFMLAFALFTAVRAPKTASHRVQCQASAAICAPERVVP